MARINLLSKQVAELIAAGEVVERPASVIKELVENSIDAGSTAITVEIQNGGITFMRITDNGCGKTFDDVPLAFKRHATSKIKDEFDLNSIATLGFRGEALAAVSSVAKVELYTKSESDIFGTHYIIEGSEQLVYDEYGCPDGTTIIVRDLFYNTPARMKFLKKDVSEGNAVSAVVERIALSHPEISFKLIKDSKNAFSTPGDGNLKAAVYSLLGREFAKSLIDVEYSGGGIKVEGLATKPVFCKKSRNFQYTFLNNRFVKSATVMAAAEQAYKNSAMVGKYPGFVLNISVPFEMVDVNVHPAKIEVRFSDEKRIFDAVYAAVMNALSTGDTRPEISVKQNVFNPFERMTTEQFRQQSIEDSIEEKDVSSFEKAYKSEAVLENSNTPMRLNDLFLENSYKIEYPSAKEVVKSANPDLPRKELSSNEKTEQPPILDEDVRLIGEAFKTYIIVQKGESVFMIDKRAAHERILFNGLKKQARAGVQILLTPLRIDMPKEEYDSIINNLDLLSKSGFEVEDFGNDCILVREVPANLTDNGIEQLMSEIALSLKSTSSVQIDRLDDIYHTVACKAAIKAGSKTSDTEMLNLAKKVLSDRNVMYCPHGRPVAFEIKKRELEKQFGRIQ